MNNGSFFLPRKMGGEETNMIEKLERNFYVGMWLIGDEAAKFAVASGLADSEEDLEIFDNDDLHSEAWKANSNFQGAGLVYPYLNGVYFYTLDGIYQKETTCSFASNEDVACLIDAKRQPMPFEAAYKNKEELFEEFRTRFGKFLPKDFDYKSHIGFYDVYDYDS